MLKRIVVIGVIGVGFALMRGDVAQAHLAGYTYSPTYRHIASYDCTGTFAQVANLDQHPAFFACEAVVREFEVLCQNPQFKVNFGNSGPRLISQSAGGPVTEDNIVDKLKGKAIKTLLLNDTNLLLAADQYCKARNRNWTAADEFVTSVDVTLKSFECLSDLATDPECVNREQAFEAKLHCDRPVNPSNGLPYTLNPRANNPPPGAPGAPVPTEYPCEVLAEAHCDQGDACPIP